MKFFLLSTSFLLLFTAGGSECMTPGSLKKVSHTSSHVSKCKEPSLLCKMVLLLPLLIHVAGSYCCNIISRSDKNVTVLEHEEKTSIKKLYPGDSSIFCQDSSFKGNGISWALETDQQCPLAYGTLPCTYPAQLIIKNNKYDMTCEDMTSFQCQRSGRRCRIKSEELLNQIAQRK